MRLWFESGTHLHDELGALCLAGAALAADEDDLVLTEAGQAGVGRRSCNILAFVALNVVIIQIYQILFKTPLCAP
jgi:hypothetical protein